MKKRNLMGTILGTALVAGLGFSQPLQAQQPSADEQILQHWQQCGYQCHNFMGFRGGLGPGRWMSSNQSHAAQLINIRRALEIKPSQAEAWYKFEDAMLQKSPWSVAPIQPNLSLQHPIPQPNLAEMQGWLIEKVKRISFAYSCLFEQLDRFQRSKAMHLLGTPPGEARDGVC
ncbi:hypothetical protein Mmc1_1913 [Magnetococcus marinus MC-1]|uniref:Uncharacterized protein n=1 Tax=Magnetococcus marinus (strain ATCC BAA-1437 / JCM 17883 / MC-1) TaxID=156889 RepID=A0L8X8_MAGMM|nr:hypothetical protein [Magnetococcus marinus]ABK44421.1 hypothetical protein Mmc1_1913 [Magnetococcus marinus MC-1]